MQWSIISGSQRKDSNSRKVAELIKKELINSNFSELDIHLLHLDEHPLPLLNETIWEQDSSLKETWKPYSEKIKQSNAFIFITPEWGGMVPASLKNFFLYCGNHELAHKPALIVSITTGIAGAYPIAELRMSSYKNTHICYIPENIILRYVDKFLSQYQAPKEEPIRELKARFLYSLKVLQAYAEALDQVRKGPNLDLESFPSGM